MWCETKKRNTELLGEAAGWQALFGVFSRLLCAPGVWSPGAVRLRPWPGSLASCPCWAARGRESQEDRRGAIPLQILQMS